MNLYDATVPVFTKLLTNINAWLDKAAGYADQKKFDVQVLLDSRLAPNMYSFTRQVQAATDQAKWTVSKMTGKEAPSWPDTEKTLDEVRGRVAKAVEYLNSFTRADFEGCEDRPCTHAWMQGKTVRAGDYLDHFALPNFHFHMATGYGILRHNGVDLSKFDYIVSLPFAEAK